MINKHNSSNMNRARNTLKSLIATNDPQACCALCGSNEQLEIDHIIPISRGGLDDSTNMQWLCSSCNKAKSNKLYLRNHYLNREYL